MELVEDWEAFEVVVSDGVVCVGDDDGEDKVVDAGRDTCAELAEDRGVLELVVGVVAGVLMMVSGLVVGVRAEGWVVPGRVVPGWVMTAKGCPVTTPSVPV